MKNTMKKTTVLMTLIVVVVGICLIPDSSTGKGNNDIGPFVQDQITSALNEENRNEISDLSSETLDLKAIFVRIQASFGIEVPFFASAKIVPEVELVFDK